MSALTLFFASDDMDVSIRGMRTDDGLEHWSVFDFINKVCEKEAGDSYGKVTFFRLTDGKSKYQAELNSYTTNLKFPGDLITLCNYWSGSGYNV